MDVGQTHVTSAEPDGKSLVIETDQVQQGSMEVVHLQPVTGKVSTSGATTLGGYHEPSPNRVNNRPAATSVP